MPSLKKLVEPQKDDLIRWFKKAQTNDQCHVVAESGQAYTHLIKISPTMVKWQITGFTGQDIDLSNTLRFTELLQTWNDFAIH